MAKVVITDFITGELDLEREILGESVEILAAEARSEAELEGQVEDADALLVYHFIELTTRTIARLERCKLIVRCGVGVDNVDWRAAAERGIPVANVPDYGTEEVADSAIGHMLGFLRGIHFLNSRLRRGIGDWSHAQVAPLRRVRGLTLGIVGLGRIGSATALRAKALGMRVLFYDPYVADGVDKSLGVERIEELYLLLCHSDVLSLHCPGGEGTEGMIDAPAISAMKPGAYLINTARGSVVDADDLLDAIESGQLAGAAIDVLPTEPPIGDEPLITAWRNPDHPAHDKLIINPHAAFYSEQGLDDMRIKGSQNCARVLRGEAPRNVVNGVTA